MKITLFTFSTLSLLCIHLNAQTGSMGINTKTPKATLDIEADPNAINSGILIPRVNTAKRIAFVEPEKGLLVYNTDLKCYETNVGTPQQPAWECLATAKRVQSITLEPIGFKGNFRYRATNNPATHKVLFKATNNTGSTLSGIDLSYVRVDGTAQYIARGQNNNISIPANSSVILEYGISGSNWTPSSVFTLSYDNLSSVSITLNTDYSGVNDPDFTGVATGDGGTATFGEMKKEIFLVKDNSTQQAINYTQKITATDPLIVKIPFTDGKGNYLAYSSPIITIKDINNADRQIKLSYPEGNLDMGKGEIEAQIITVDGQEIYLPQTTLAVSKTIAQIPIKLNNADKGTFDLIAFGGIPDKRYGDGSNHDFVYMPVVSPSGRTWLNNNLGAEYNRVQSPVFNPQQQAKTIDDINALGSVFQKNRYSDGHELTHINGTSWIKNSTNTNTLADTYRPNHSKIIINPKSLSNIPITQRKYNWVTDKLKTAPEWEQLWTLNGQNNPCPEGYRPPTSTEMEIEISFLPEFSDKGLFLSVLKIPIRPDGSTRYFWGSNINRVLDANPSNVQVTGNGEQFTNGVRCIKN